MTGPAPTTPDDRRRFVRFRCRGRAILERGADQLAGFIADASRGGMGIISPVQLFPMERVQITTFRLNVPLIKRDRASKHPHDVQRHHAIYQNGIIITTDGPSYMVSTARRFPVDE